MENSRRTPSRQFLAQPRGQIGYHPLAQTELAEERMREAWEALDGALNYTVADSASASTFPAWW